MCLHMYNNYYRANRGRTSTITAVHVTQYWRADIIIVVVDGVYGDRRVRPPGSIRPGVTLKAGRR